MSRDYGTVAKTGEEDDRLPLLQLNGDGLDTDHREGRSDTSVDLIKKRYPLVLLLLGILVVMVLYVNDGSTYSGPGMQTATALQEDGLPILSPMEGDQAKDASNTFPTPTDTISDSDEPQLFKVVTSLRTYLVKPGTTKEEAEAKYQAYLSELMNTMSEDEKKVYEQALAKEGTTASVSTDTTDVAKELLDTPRSEDSYQQDASKKTQAQSTVIKQTASTSTTPAAADTGVKGTTAPAKIDTSVHITVPSDTETSAGEHLLKKSKSNRK